MKKVFYILLISCLCLVKIGCLTESGTKGSEETNNATLVESVWIPEDGGVSSEKLLVYWYKLIQISTISIDAGGHTVLLPSQNP